jgi:hypothetical protein
MKDTTAQFETASPNIIDSSPSIKPKYAASLEGQRNMAFEYVDKPLKLGDKWYLISSDWYTRWLKYIGIETVKNGLSNETKRSTNPGPSPDAINNKSLLDLSGEKPRLKTNIIEEIDYYAIPEELWDYLTKIYPLTNKEVCTFTSFPYFGFYRITIYIAIRLK